MERKYPLIRQTEDERDLQVTIPITEELPDKIDLRENCPPVFDQGNIGSCTSQAGVGAYMMLKDTDILHSRLYLYFKERFLEDAIDEDNGATMRSIGKALHKFGVCTEKMHPYISSKFKNTPTEQADKEAENYKINAYKKLSNINQIKEYLVKKQQPVMIGMEIYSSFESRGVIQTGIVPMPKKDERFLGGHAVLIVGYDDNFGKNKVKKGFLNSLFRMFASPNNNNGYFIVRNSWGEGFGDDGYFYLSYEFMKEHTFDYWVIE